MQSEEIILLFDLLYLSVGMVRAVSVDELFLRLERFAARAIESGVFLFVDVSCSDQLIPEFLSAGIMRLDIRGPEEGIVRY